MFEVNQYFDGKVQSQSFENSKGRFTSGIMSKGEYEFATSAKEWMTLVSGGWKIQLPGETTFTEYAEGSTFEVEANQKFQVQALEDTAYLCRYK